MFKEVLNQDTDYTEDRVGNYFARIKTCKNGGKNINNSTNINLLIKNCNDLYKTMQIYAPKPQYLRKNDCQFFKNNEKTLNTLFANFSRDAVLEKMFKTSKWVRVETESDIWVVGIVYHNNKPAFLGVGQPWLKEVPVGNNFNTPFGVCKFYPISTNSKFGYFINFKDADFGKVVLDLL